MSGKPRRAARGEARADDGLLPSPKDCMRSRTGRRCDRCGTVAAVCHVPTRVAGVFCPACCPMCNGAQNAAPSHGNEPRFVRSGAGEGNEQVGNVLASEGGIMANSKALPELYSRRKRDRGDPQPGCVAYLGMEENCSVCGAPARPLHVVRQHGYCGRCCPECSSARGQRVSSDGREPAKTATQFQPEELTK